MKTASPSKSPLYARWPVRALGIAISLSLATLAVALAFEHAPSVRRADPPVSAVSASGPQDVRGEPADDARDDELGRTTGPRECRPEAGIVTECIFN